MAYGPSGSRFLLDANTIEYHNHHVCSLYNTYGTATETMALVLEGTVYSIRTALVEDILTLMKMLLGILTTPSGLPLPTLTTEGLIGLGQLLMDCPKKSAVPKCP